MIQVTDLPDTLPVFPLPGALLLPRARLPLHIFEPRYLAMIDDALKSDQRLIGMVQPNGDQLYHFGCAGRIVSFSETDDGRYMITLGGVSRFRLGPEQDGFHPYLRHSISWQGFGADLHAAAPEEFDRDSFMSLLRRYFDMRGLDADWDSLRSAEDELLINSLSMLCPFSTEDKQALLESPSLADRRATLITLIEFAFRQGDSEERLQ